MIWFQQGTDLIVSQESIYPGSIVQISKHFLNLLQKNFKVVDFTKKDNPKPMPFIIV
jgi:hypothetical protein